MPHHYILRRFRTFKLFISHAWDRSEDYDGVIDLLRSDPEFKFEDLSAPEHRPLLTSPELPRSNRFFIKQLDDRIKSAECVLILAGMYCGHRAWIQSEIEAALEFKTPLIGVAPRGQERIPVEVSRVAEMVRWNSKSIVEAICKNATAPRSSSRALYQGLLSTPTQR